MSFEELILVNILKTESLIQILTSKDFSIEGELAKNIKLMLENNQALPFETKYTHFIANPLQEYSIPEAAKLFKMRRIDFEDEYVRTFRVGLIQRGRSFHVTHSDLELAQKQDKEKLFNSKI